MNEIFKNKNMRLVFVTSMSMTERVNTLEKTQTCEKEGTNQKYEIHVFCFKHSII